MKLVSALVLQKLMAKLRWGYSKKMLTITFKSSENIRLRHLLELLISVGFISHFECIRNLRRQNLITYRVYLSYLAGKPVLKGWHYRKSTRSTRPICHRVIRKWLIHSPGTKLIFQTSIGLLSAEQCLTRGRGGFLVCGFTR